MLSWSTITFKKVGKLYLICYSSSSLISEKGTWSEFDCFKFIRTLCPSFDTKFLELHTNALITNSPKFSSWQYIAEDFVKQVPLFMLEENLPCKSIYTKVIIRGGFQTMHDYNCVKKVLLSKAFTPVEWILYTSNSDDYVSFDISHSSALPSYKLSQSLTVCSNRTYIISLLDHVLSRAHSMMESNAYLHWYTRYGVDQDFFDECFSVAQQVIDDYVLLYKP